jgi:hypothetical protein
MASSYVESEDSEECEIDSDFDFEVENGNQAVLKYQKSDNLKKELEREDRVSFCSITFYRRNTERAFYKFCCSLPFLRHRLYREVSQPLSTDKTWNCRNFNRSVILF